MVYSLYKTDLELSTVAMPKKPLIDLYKERSHLILKMLTKALRKPTLILNIFKRQFHIQKNDYEHFRWKRPEFLTSQLEHLTRAYYEEHRDIEGVEHQVGRYLNMKDIAAELASQGQSGDIVEFGTYQGLGLIVLGKCFAKDDTQRKLIGIDSFKGLPSSSTIWEQGWLADTNIDLVHTDVSRYLEKQHSLELIEGWFDDPLVREKLYKTTDDVCLVHFDADLGSSTATALKIIEPYLASRVKPIYFLFDDWGCHPDEVPDAFFNWFISLPKNLIYRLEKLSSTRYTRYYRLTPVSS